GGGMPSSIVSITPALSAEPAAARGSSSMPRAKPSRTGAGGGVATGCWNDVGFGVKARLNEFLIAVMVALIAPQSRSTPISGKSSTKSTQYSPWPTASGTTMSAMGNAITFHMSVKIHVDARPDGAAARPVPGELAPEKTVF